MLMIYFYKCFSQTVFVHLLKHVFILKMIWFIKFNIVEIAYFEVWSISTKKCKITFLYIYKPVLNPVIVYVYLL